MSQYCTKKLSYMPTGEEQWQWSKYTLTETRLLLHAGVFFIELAPVPSLMSIVAPSADEAYE